MLYYFASHRSRWTVEHMWEHCTPLSLSLSLSLSLDVFSLRERTCMHGFTLASKGSEVFLNGYCTPATPGTTRRTEPRARSMGGLLLSHDHMSLFDRLRYAKTEG